MISIRTHNIVDYVLGAFLISAPHLLGFVDVPEARRAFFWAGVFLLAYSCFTRYAHSVLKVISIRAHMKLDIAVGAWLILAPTILHYNLLISPNLLGLHVIIGFGVIFFVGITHYRHEESIAGSKVTLDSGGFHWGST